MSEPRMIPADEAKNIQALFSSFGNLSNRERKIRDLAVTVMAQAAQIERVREALADLEAEIGRRAAAPHVNPTETTLGMSRAARLIREALGGTDEDH